MKYCKCSKNIKFIELFHHYKIPPPLEPKYGIKKYSRKIFKCKLCGHFSARHKIKVSEFYKKNYSLISHGKKMRIKFNKIISLKSKSDNYQRVKRFLIFFNKFKKKKITLLDVGSGLSLFIFGLQKIVNWNLTGIEPDINFVKFARTLKLNVVHSNLKSGILQKKKFNIISLNKIIEHVKDPVKLLKISYRLLLNNGYVYVEVPDGSKASRVFNGYLREEFFVDHLHIFSKQSLKKCIEMSGFKIMELKSIKERSGKYTIFAFAKKLHVR
ncbi:class I SAM-dependent methyltransferase [Pelagibacterales bacterium SAG-MED45]|nr:class I SAM-dependent methyltransferase [Pelagibacterales bacterium SAG-MED45]